MNTMYIAVAMLAVACVLLGMNLAYVKLWPNINFSVQFEPHVEQVLLEQERNADRHAIHALGPIRVFTVEQALEFRAAGQRLGQSDDERLVEIAKSLQR